ncbi:MAG: hypothetical protein EOP05_22810, partial [Proteobacteria bacterium]
MSWIFGKAKFDAMFLIAPAFVSLLLAMSGVTGESLIYAFIATALIDSGHVYTTIWRTWLHAKERRSAKLYYFAVPILIAAIITGWLAFGLPYFWSFVVYATLHHHARQFYGISRWYQSLNKRLSIESGRFIYAFALLPIIAYHFRPDAIDGYYSQHDLILFKNETVYDLLNYAWDLLFLSWVVFEVRTWKSGVHEVNRIASIAVPALLYAGCFFIGETLPQILFPLLFAHGIAYFGLMSLSVERTRKETFKSFKMAFAIMLITACAFGTAEYFVEDEFLDFDKPIETIGMAFFIGLYLVPL